MPPFALSLSRRQFGALQHALAEHSLFARIGASSPSRNALEPAVPEVSELGAPAPGAEQGEGEQAERRRSAGGVVI